MPCRLPAARSARADVPLCSRSHLPLLVALGALFACFCCGSPTLPLPHPAPPPLAAALGIGSRYNKSRVGIWVKLGASLALTALVWEVKPIFYGIWRPFTFAMGYDDPRRPSGDLLRGEVGHSPPAPPPPPFGVQCDPLRPNAASAAVD